MSKIQWTEKTWNPVVGCSVVSAGCTNCYAMKMAKRLEAMGNPDYAGLTKTVNGNAVWTGAVRCLPEKLGEPLKWRKPARVFVNSMSDLFHEGVPDEFIDKVFAVMALCPQHTFQILTKRPERMKVYLLGCQEGGRLKPSLTQAVRDITPDYGGRDGAEVVYKLSLAFRSWPWPLPNVWLGVSVEDQKTADERIPILLQTPAAVRFVSYEPALQAVDFSRFLNRCVCASTSPVRCGCGISWIIIGGESGPSSRPFDLQWARDTIRQCREAGVACFVKQLGSNAVNRKVGGFMGRYSTPMDHKGGDLSEWPEDLRVREYPA